MYDSDDPVPYDKREVMVTVRMPNEERERLRDEAQSLRISMNYLAKMKLARRLPAADAQRIRNQTQCTNLSKPIGGSADPIETIDWL